MFSWVRKIRDYDRLEREVEDLKAENICLNLKVSKINDDYSELVAQMVDKEYNIERKNEFIEGIMNLTSHYFSSKEEV